MNIEPSKNAAITKENKYFYIMDFNPSRYLLCIALIKKFGYSFENIKQKLDKHTDNINNLLSIILKLINKNKLNEKTVFKR